MSGCGSAEGSEQRSSACSWGRASRQQPHQSLCAGPEASQCRCDAVLALQGKAVLVMGALQCHCSRWQAESKAVVRVGTGHSDSVRAGQL